jgi:hypothetical protein
MIKTTTIQIFIKEYIHSKACINNNLRQEPLSSINMEYLIDLYELIEEYVFDKILRDNIRDELCEKSFPIAQRTSIINQFIDMIIHNGNIAHYFKDLICWISMFKRLLVRLLSPKVHINFESSLHNYVKRTDMWKGNITEDNIRTLEIKNDVRLKHAFIILKGLEAKQEEKTSIEKHGNLTLSGHKQRNTMQTNNSALQSMNTSQKRNDPIRNDFRE